MSKKTKILIFGGSFDPPHKKHIQILKDAIKEIKPSKSFIVPTYLSPFKKIHLFSYLERKWMLNEILKKEKIKATICDFEYKRKKKTYTWMLIKKIKEKYPDSQLYFLLGSDSINQIKKWKKFDFLSKNLIFVIAKREKYDLKIPKKLRTVILKKTYENISSTKIREEIFCGILKNIPSSIKRYIKSRLKIDIIKKVKNMIEPARFNHTIQVVKMAVNLAWIYGEDLKKAFLAAVLHDISKNMNIRKQINLIKSEGLKIKDLNNIIKKHQKILHQWTSMIVAKKIFNIKDREVLSAISKHTTATKNMSKLDKIVYISDFISYDRKFKGIKKLRDIAKKNLNDAFKKIYKIKKEYAKKYYGEVYEAK